MKPATILYQHPDGDGNIEHAPGVLIAANDLDATVTRIAIDTAGLRSLADRLTALADELQGGGK